MDSRSPNSIFDFSFSYEAFSHTTFPPLKTPYQSIVLLCFLSSALLITIRKEVIDETRYAFIDAFFYVLKMA